jgi:hypothetical protein
VRSLQLEHPATPLPTPPPTLTRHSSPTHPPTHPPAHPPGPKAAQVTWNCLLCLVLFSLANFLKSLTAKLISQHFYKTAHVAKVKQALQQEYYLLSLSKPRPSAGVVQQALGKMPSGEGG